MPDVTIAAVSLRPRADVAEVERVIGLARRRGADLVVLPEAALGGYLLEEVVEGTIVRGAPPVLTDPEETFARLRRVAGETVVCVGYTERSGTSLHASVVCLTGDGILGHQRKVHIPPGERGLIAPGEGFAAFDTPVGRIGMLVCYDKIFPEAARRLADDGAEILVCPAAWAVCREHPARMMRNDRQVRHFNAFDLARAIENQVVWVSANQVGHHGRLRFPGQSRVVDPDGRVLAGTGARPGFAIATIDPAAAVRAARDEISHLGDRLPDAYAPAGSLTPSI